MRPSPASDDAPGGPARLELPDASLVYEVRGQGAPVVFIHGAFADRQLWAPQVRALASTGRWQTITYDLRGHGQTGPTPRDPYSVGVLVDDLGALLDHLRLERVSLVGLSLGGMIAQAFAAISPERIDRLVLADTAISLGHTLPDRLLRDVIAPRWLVKLATRSMDLPGMVDASFAVAEWTWAAEWLGPPHVRDYLRRAMRAVSSREYSKIYDALYVFEGVRPERLSCPTLILCGRQESWPMRRHATLLASQIPNASLRWIDDAAHVSNLHQPARFNEALVGFLPQPPP